MASSWAGKPCSLQQLINTNTNTNTNTNNDTKTYTITSTNTKTNTYTNTNANNKVFFEGAPPVNGYKKGPISAEG